MARVEIPEIVIDAQGHPVAGASVQVTVRGGVATTVYEDEYGAATVSNPIITTSLGRIEGWLEEGSYTLSVTYNGGSYDQAYEAAKGGSGYSLIEEDGFDLPQRASLSFEGDGVTAFDDATPGFEKTLARINGTHWQDEGGSVLTYKELVNVVGAGASVSNSGDTTVLNVPGGVEGQTTTAGVAAAMDFWKPTGCVVQTFPRWGQATITTPVAGQLNLTGVTLPAGVAINSISFFRNSTITGPTHQWFCLVRQSDLTVIRKTSDDTSTPWAATSLKTLTLTSSYTPTTDERVYLGIVCTASGGLGNLISSDTNANELNALPPIYCGRSTTGLTDPASLGATADALTANTAQAWAMAS